MFLFVRSSSGSWMCAFYLEKNEVEHKALLPETPRDHTNIIKSIVKGIT